MRRDELNAAQRQVELLRADVQHLMDALEIARGERSRVEQERDSLRTQHERAVVEIAVYNRSVADLVQIVSEQDDEHDELLAGIAEALQMFGFLIGPNLSDKRFLAHCGLVLSSVRTGSAEVVGHLVTGFENSKVADDSAGEPAVPEPVTPVVEPDAGPTDSDPETEADSSDE
jgi:hypothetical protein